MKKLGMIILVFFFVGLAYLIMMTLQPFTNQVIDTVNSTANWTNYPETQAVLVGWPFWAYLLPAGMGMVAVFFILKGDSK